MADVFLARDHRLGRDVAVKVLRPGPSLGTSEQRFRREIETVSRLQHPNIVAVHDVGTVDGRIFFVMPFVSGESLRDRIRRVGHLDWPVALALLHDVAEALMHAHEHGVIHRDIKPENILIAGDRALIADFGIARLVENDGAPLLTKAGEGLGTPMYMSPEQAFGEDGVDARADVYSLACVGFEMLTGEPPFPGHNAYAILTKKSREPAPALPAHIAEAVPPGTAEVIARSLAAAPEARHQSPRAFIEALSTPLAPAAMNTQPAVSGPKPVPALTTMLVLPFVNGSTQPGDDILCDGIAEELIHALSRVAGLQVVARTSAFAFKGFLGDIRDVARQLNVGAVLEGSLRRSGDRLRLTVRLVDGETGYDRWSERYDRMMANVLDLQDELAGAVVEAVKGTLGVRDRRLLATTTTSVEAYRFYLEALFHWNQRTEAGFQTAMSLLGRATTIDPGYADAHAAAAVTSATMGIYGTESPAAAFGAARDSAENALALRAGHSDALAARACASSVLLSDWRGAEADFHRAASARSATPTTLLWYAMHLLVPQRRFDEALAALHDARRLDPLAPLIPLSAGLARLYAGHADAAVAEIGVAVAAHPALGVGHFFLGQALIGAGRAADAIPALARARTAMGEAPELLAALAVAHAASGDAPAVASTVSRIRALSAVRYVSPVTVAQAEAAAGNREAALAALEAAAEVRAADLVWVDLRPALLPLHSEPRYQDVLARIGLAQTLIPTQAA